MKRLALFLGLLLAGSVAYPQQAGKQSPNPGKPVTSVKTSAPAAPWSLGVEERIALRANAGLAQQRSAEYRQSGGASRIRTATADSGIADAFEGKTHPELFLPFEVFRHFIDLTFRGDAHMREVVREGMGAEVRRAGLPPDFWTRLESVTAAYVADVRAEGDLLATRPKVTGPARQRIDKRLEIKQDEVCLSRAAALAAARNAFGRETFDRFLYQAVAAHMFYMSDRVPTAAELRSWEGGCR